MNPEIYWTIALPHDDRSLLSVEENKRATRYRNKNARFAFITGRTLLRKLLSWRNPAIKPQDWPIYIDSFGKPKLGNNFPLVFNISHTTNLVIVVLAETPIMLGVDIEDPYRKVSTDRLLHRFFSPSEIASYDALSQKKQRERFFALWTTNEAYVKALGTGLQTSLASFDVEFHNSSRKTQSIKPVFLPHQAFIKNKPDWILRHGPFVFENIFTYIALAFSSAKEAVFIQSF